MLDFAKRHLRPVLDRIYDAYATCCGAIAVFSFAMAGAMALGLQNS